MTLRLTCGWSTPADAGVTACWSLPFPMAPRSFWHGSTQSRGSATVAVPVALARTVTGRTAPGGSPQANRLSSR